MLVGAFAKQALHYTTFPGSHREREKGKKRESESALFGKLLQIFSYYAWLLARSHHIPLRTTFLAVWNLTRDCALAFWSLPKLWKFGFAIKVEPQSRWQLQRIFFIPVPDMIFGINKWFHKGRISKPRALIVSGGETCYFKLNVKQSN